MQKCCVPTWRICKCASIAEVSQVDGGSNQKATGTMEEKERY